MKTHCKRGHKYTPENTRWNGKTRSCRQCRIDRLAAARLEAGRAARQTFRKLKYWKLTDLRRLVDVVWQHATESTAVPSTKTADKLIELAASALSSTHSKSPALDWKLDRPECPRCKGQGRVGVMACNDCGATGVLLPSTDGASR